MARRVYKGIPERMRGIVWARLLDVKKVKSEQEGIYEVWIFKYKLLSFSTIRNLSVMKQCSKPNFSQNFYSFISWFKNFRNGKQDSYLIFEFITLLAEP